ncbi:scavenger receptor class B member 1-like [Agrilus planipennis]|uniref:Scavenger receptor class B member 1 n=1 Tax=Agrilus planipennis TaxID=224129 RepID=A0A1W4X6N5_AGRPL|nr:scavenger receptor class B member 1-like [Agrilus planipennis]
MAKIYPSLDYLREVHNNSPPSNLETNCGQIFSKTPAITKEFLDIIELKDIAPKKTNICGYVLKTRRIWVLSGLFLLFLSSLTGSIVMWFTGTFDRAVLSNFVLSNNTLAYENWKMPPVRPLLKIHLFNYTNVDAYGNGIANKFKVQDVGPFVYEETLEKVNVRFHQDSTVSYQEKRSYKFRPDLSSRKTTSILTVPNLPMLGAVSVNRFSYYMVRLSLATVFNGIGVRPFINLPAHKFIWGYEDILYTLAKTVMPLEDDVPVGNFGLMMARNGTSNDIITVNTGENGMSKLNYVNSYNGQGSLPHWHGKRCNKIEGSDGSFFPPYSVRNKRPLYIYKKEMCRRLPLIYDKEVNVFKGRIPAYRYVLPKDIFDLDAEENKCFCQSNDECPPRGVFNVSACAFGAPFFISLPHFYNADPVLMKNIEGLQPDPEKHDSFLNLHKLGFPMVGVSRFQLNVLVRKPFGISHMDMFPEEMYLPVAWIEMSISEEEISDDLMDLINTLTFTIPNTESALKYGSVLTVLVTFFAILIVLRNQWLEQREELRISSSY